MTRGRMRAQFPLPHGPVVKPMHWLQSTTIASVTAYNASERVYASATDIKHLGRAGIQWAWPRVFFVAVCAVVYRMRSGDSESVSSQGIATPGWIQFFDEKRGKEWVQYPLSAYLEGWRKYVDCNTRTPPWATPLCQGAGTSYEKCWQNAYDTH